MRQWKPKLCLLMLAGLVGTSVVPAALGVKRRPAETSTVVVGDTALLGSLLGEVVVTTTTTSTTEAPVTTTTTGAPRIVRPEPSRGAPVVVSEPPTDLEGMPRTLRRIAGCESNGQADAEINWTAQNRYSNASGGFQDLDSTWQQWSAQWGSVIAEDLGADMDPRQWYKARLAPPAVQLAVNLHAYLEGGTSPWVSSRGCWG